VDEFEIIERYFRPLGNEAPGVVLGIGDDAAVLEVQIDEQLVVTTDTQVESVHFPSGGPPRDIGYRSCATSLSDIAAMGASARWASLAVTMPGPEPAWLEDFALGAAEALGDAGAVLIGGDTTAGPLVITWYIIGTAPVGAALRRNGARKGDAVYVSGTLGDASAAVELALFDESGHDESGQAVLDRYWHPRARFDLARILCGRATSCIDVSDGLIADLTHVVRASRCGAEVEYSRIPISPALSKLVGPERARLLAATGGDDYELCFTVPVAGEPELVGIAREAGLRIARIGRMVSGNEVRIVGDSGAPIDLGDRGYRHFD
jgi:thiamine-monophosphate kinase